MYTFCDNTSPAVYTFARGAPAVYTFRDGTTPAVRTCRQKMYTVGTALFQKVYTAPCTGTVYTFCNGILPAVYTFRQKPYTVGTAPSQEMYTVPYTAVVHTFARGTPAVYTFCDGILPAVVELKYLRGPRYSEKGEQQVADSPDHFNLKEGYMLSFNFNKHKERGMKRVAVCDKILWGKP